MDKHLRPSRFECEPNIIDAEKQWRHWYRTFENFITSIQFPAEATPATIQEQKLSTLINYVSPSIYEFISEVPDYNSAVDILKNLYVKPVNVIYNRHILITHRQNESETVDQYLQQLEKLSKNFNFTDVTAENYRQEYVRDAFINGLKSPDIRQRLLKNHAITLQQTFAQARTLELTKKHSASFQSPSQTYDVAATKVSNSSGNRQSTTSQKQKCFFCGNDRHPRARCPAKDSVCNKCAKVGHREKVCQSKFTLGALSIQEESDNQPSLCAIEHLHKNHTDQTVTTAYIKSQSVKTLKDSGSDISFISQKLVNQLNLFVIPTKNSVKLADRTPSSSIIGEVVIDVVINNKPYAGLTVSVMRNLCVDLLMGKDFMKKHKSVTFQFDGSLPALLFPAKKSAICCLSVMNIDPPSLFSNLPPDTKPIASKSRKYSKSDLKFIQEVIKRLLSEGVIEESTSPWSEPKF